MIGGMVPKRGIPPQGYYVQQRKLVSLISPVCQPRLGYGILTHLIVLTMAALPSSAGFCGVGSALLSHSARFLGL